MLVGSRWYNADDTADRLNDTFEWDDETIRTKCTQGTARLYQAFLDAGYQIRLKPPSHSQRKIITKDGNISLEYCQSMDEVLSAISRKYGVSERDLLSKKKTWELILARQEAYRYCKNVLKLSTTKIGAFFNRDHSTIVSQLRGGRGAAAKAKLASIN